MYGVDSTGEYHDADNGFDLLGANDFAADGVDYLSADWPAVDRTGHLGTEGLKAYSKKCLQPALRRSQKLHLCPAEKVHHPRTPALGVTSSGSPASP